MPCGLREDITAIYSGHHTVLSPDDPCVYCRLTEGGGEGKGSMFWGEEQQNPVWVVNLGPELKYR